VATVRREDQFDGDDQIFQRTNQRQYEKHSTGGGIVVNDSATAEISPEEGVSGGSNTITGNGGAGANARDEVFVDALRPRR
jgi:hypothetical protein